MKGLHAPGVNSSVKLNCDSGIGLRRGIGFGEVLNNAVVITRSGLRE